MKLKTDKIIYHTETQEDFDDLMIKLFKQGVEPLSRNEFTEKKERTCVRLRKYNRLAYGDLDFYTTDSDFADYEIVKYKADSNPYKVKLKANQRFLVDWYEKHKDDFDYNLWDLIRYGTNKVYQYISNEDGIIAMLVNMHQFGYEIEEEPRYIVKLPNPNTNGKSFFCLRKTDDKRIIMTRTKKIMVNNYLTEFEIKQDFEWAWQFAKEVE